MQLRTRTTTDPRGRSRRRRKRNGQHTGVIFARPCHRRSTRTAQTGSQVPDLTLDTEPMSSGRTCGHRGESSSPTGLRYPPSYRRRQARLLVRSREGNRQQRHYAPRTHVLHAPRPRRRFFVRSFVRSLGRSRNVSRAPTRRTNARRERQLALWGFVADVTPNTNKRRTGGDGRTPRRENGVTVNGQRELFPRLGAISRDSYRSLSSRPIFTVARLVSSREIETGKERERGESLPQE